MGNRKNEDARWWVMQRQFQKNSLEWAIEFTGSVNKAAKYLGLNHGYVYKLCKKLGVNAQVRDYTKRGPDGLSDADEEAIEDALREDEAPQAPFGEGAQDLGGDESSVEYATE
jgi:hypothetical protein